MYFPGQNTDQKGYMPAAPVAPEQPQVQPEIPTPTPKVQLSENECWGYLRTERNNRLASTDYVNAGAIPLTLQQRNDLYIYRRALRDITSLPGAPWTPDTIPWPVAPVITGAPII